MGVRQALNAAAEIQHPDAVGPAVDAATFVDVHANGDVDFAFAFVVVVVALVVEGVPVCSVLDRLPSICWHFVGDLEYLIAVEYLTGVVGLVATDALAVYDDYIVVAFVGTRYSMQIAWTHCLLQLVGLAAAAVVVVVAILVEFDVVLDLLHLLVDGLVAYSVAVSLASIAAVVAAY